MTKTLSLLRHAKSSWDDSVPTDFDRPLNDKGKKAAEIMGRWLAREGLRFDHVIASPAVRVKETIANIEAGYGGALGAEWDRKLYLAATATLYEVLRECSSDADHMLIIGHNPTLEDAACELARKTDDPLVQQLYEKYPTGTYAQICLDIDSWDDVAPDTGTLTHFKRPRDLDPSLGPDRV